MKRMLLILGVFGWLVIGCGQAEQSQDRPSTQTERRSAGQAAIVDDGSDPNIVQIAAGSENHTTLVAALEHANYVDPLANPGPFTVFAPTNAAFEALPDGVLDDLLKPENEDQLKDILEYHVLIGVYTTESMFDGQIVGTANGPPVSIEKRGDGTVLVNGHHIVASIRGANGVIHVIESVLLP